MAAWCSQGAVPLRPGLLPAAMHTVCISIAFVSITAVTCRHMATRVAPHDCPPAVAQRHALAAQPRPYTPPHPLTLTHSWGGRSSSTSHITSSSSSSRWWWWSPAPQGSALQGVPPAREGLQGRQPRVGRRVLLPRVMMTRTAVAAAAAAAATIHRAPWHLWSDRIVE